MKRFLVLSLLLAAASRAHAGMESLKAADLSAAWNAAKTAQIAAPAIPGAVRAQSPLLPAAPRPGQSEIARYGRQGFASQYNAQSALQQAETNLRQLGVSMLASRVLRDSSYPYNYRFEIEYYADSWNPLRISTYRGGTHTSEWNARNEMERTLANMRAAGQQLILGLVIRENSYPYNYYYEVDYLDGRHRPGPGPRPDHPRVQVYQSPVYGTVEQAKREYDYKQASLQRQGYEIVNGKLHQAGYRGWYFVIQYRSHRGGGRRPHRP